MRLGRIRCEDGGWRREADRRGAGSGEPAPGRRCVSLLQPEEQVFSAMLAGFANQQLARNLARSTVGPGEHGAGLPPLRQRLPLAVEPRDGRRVAGRSAVAARSQALDDPLLLRGGPLVLPLRHRPGLRVVGDLRGSLRHATIQVLHEWNTAVHVQASEAEPAKRAFTKKELHAFLPTARTRWPHPRVRPQGLAAGVRRRHAVQDRHGYRLFSPPQRQRLAEQRHGLLVVGGGAARRDSSRNRHISIRSSSTASR